MTRLGLIAAVVLVLVACAQHSLYREGIRLIDAGELETGLAKLQEASNREPRNAEFRQAYYRYRDMALHRLLAQADAARIRGDWSAARNLYDRMLLLDPTFSRGISGLERTAAGERHGAQIVEAQELLNAGAFDAAAARTQAVVSQAPTNREAQQLLRRIEEASQRATAERPRLAAAFRRPLTLQFQDASLRHAFDAIGRTAGLNFLFDRDVRADDRITIAVRETSVEDALGYILVTNQLAKKILSDNTILVYPNTPAKARDYQELVVRVFYLTNADVKTTANLIRTLVKTKDIFLDEKLNLLVLRDTPEAIRIAERLIAGQDLAEAEVMLDVEILEVSANTLQDLGIKYPDSLAFGLVGADGIPGTITLGEWRRRSADLVRIAVSDPLLALKLRSEFGRSNILANPRIRVKNKDKARVHIGDRVPVITTTTTATGFASESVSYLDVGLKLEVEPAIYLDDEVGIRVGLEVSSIVREIRGASGALTYQIGTRNAITSLRLKDGETQVLAGLISDEDRKSAQEVPGLGSLPLIGRLFANHQDTNAKTEIVLLITPRVIRNIARPNLDLGHFQSGTEGTLGAPPLQLREAR